MIHNYDREWSKKGAAPNNNNNYSFRRQLPPPPLPPQNFPHYPTSMQHPPSSSHFGAGIEKEISVVVEEFRRSRSDIQAPPNALTVPFLLHHLCIHFRISSHEELGLGNNLFQIPAIHQIQLLNQRIWNFVVCFVQSRRINTLFECYQGFLLSEGVSTFNELGIGNSFLHTEAVQLYYHSPQCLMELTTRQVLEKLQAFQSYVKNDLARGSSHLDRNEFLTYLAQSFNQPNADKMGLYVDPNGFGMYIGMMRRISNHEMKEMKALEQEFQKGIAEKVFELTKEKFSANNRQKALEELLSRQMLCPQQKKQQQQDSQEKNLNSSKNTTTCTCTQQIKRSSTSNFSLSLDVLKRVTEIDVYLDSVLKQKSKSLPAETSNAIAKMDSKIRNQLTRFLVSTQGSKNHSRIKVVTWVLCGIMAKIQTLLSHDDKVPEPKSFRGKEMDAEEEEEEEKKEVEEEEEEEECTCCCVGKPACNCSCKCDCHEESDADEKDISEEKVEEVQKKSGRKSQKDQEEINKTDGGNQVDVDIIEQLVQECNTFVATSNTNGMETLEEYLTEKFPSWKAKPVMNITLQVLGVLCKQHESNATWLKALPSSIEKKPNAIKKVSIEEMAMFVVQCLYFCYRSREDDENWTTFSEIPGKIYESIEQQIKCRFGIENVSELGFGATIEALVKHLLEQRGEKEEELIPWSFFPESTLVFLDAIKNSNKVELAVDSDDRRRQMIEEAKEMLLEVGYLEDIMKAVDWKKRFQASCGPLYRFIQEHLKPYRHNFLALELTTGQIIRIRVASRPSDLDCEYVDNLDPQNIATHLVSMYVLLGELHFPNQLVSSQLKRLFAMIWVSKKEIERSNALGKFILEMVMWIPTEFYELIWQSLFVPILLKSFLTSEKRLSDVLWSLNPTKKERQVLKLLGITEEIKTHGQMKQVQKSKKAESGGSISIATSTTSGLDVLPNSVVTVQPKQNVQVQLDTSTCRAFIETLRREQFGIGLKLTPETSSIFLAQQKRLERALKRLSDELYSESTHFVLELLQNADDNNYASNIIPRGEFLLSNSAVVFFNNEMGFTKDNIRALCDVGASTKASSHHKTTNNREERASLIGKKGIGFKSVFKVSNMPQVHSNGFHIGFHARSKNGFGYILPHWLEPKDTEWIIDPRPFGTTFVLPFQNHEDKHKESLKQLFDDVQSNVLLFLKQLKEIVLEDKLSRPTRRLHIRLEKKKLIKSDGADDDDDGEEEEEENTLVTLYANDMPEFWLMKSKMIQVPSFSFDGIQRAQTTRLSLAFPIQKMDDVSMSTPLQVQSASLQSVFCYLPLRSYGLRFVIQADFDVPSSREAISSGSAWNEWLISHVPTLFVDALLLFHSQKRSLLEFFAFFPKEKEVQSPFRIVCQEISRLLQKRPCLPVVEEDAALVLVSPHQVLDITRLVHLVRQEIEQTKSGNESKYDESEVTRRVEQLLTQVLPSALIKQVFNKQFLQVEFGCRLPTSVKRSLRIETWTSNHLLKLLTHPLMINHLADNHTKRVQLLLWAVQLGIQERPNGHEMSLFIHELRLIRLFPVKKFLNKNTTKSRLVSTEDCQNALFLSETSHDFSNTDHLRQVDDMLAVVQDGLFVLETDFASCLNQASNYELKRFLVKHGIIKQMDDHNLLKHHILPSLQALMSSYQQQQDTSNKIVYTLDLMMPKSNEENKQQQQHDTQKEKMVVSFFEWIANHFMHCGCFKVQKEIVAIIKALVCPSIASLKEPFMVVIHGDQVDKLKHTVSLLDEGQANVSFNCIMIKCCDDAKWTHLFKNVLQLRDLSYSVATDKSPIVELLMHLDKNLDESENVQLKKRDVSVEMAHFVDTHWSALSASLSFESLLKSLREMKWVLGTDGYLHVPNELHVRTEACRKVWKDSSVVPFSVYTFSNSLVLDSLLFIQEPTHQSVLNAMESISQAADLHQQSHFSVEQATCLYFFLNEKAQKDPSNSSEIKKAFQERNLIFIERERSDPMTDHGGRFCSAHDVFWSAKSAQAFFGSKSSSFFTNASNNVLETMYPSQLCSFFVEICGIDKKPSVQWMCDQLLWRQQQKKKTPTFKKLLPLLRHLSKQIKQENLDQKQILLIKRTLATAVPLQSWLPIVQEELTKGASVSLSPEMLANVVYALSEEEKQIQDQVLRLKNKKEKDILFIDLEAHDTVRKLVPLYQALGIQPLCQHVLSRVNSWCQLVSSHSLEEEVTQELVSGLMGVWISCLMSVEDSSNDIKQQIKKTLTMNEHRICPVITSSSALSSIRFVHFTEAYVNDQTDISMEDITAIGVPTVAFTNTFWLTTFMKKKKISKRNKQLKQKAKLYIVLQEALGCKSLQAHLTSSVHFTRTLPSDHDQKKQVEALVQGGLALANRILFHQYPKLYKKYASTIANIKSFLVEGPLDIVYQMKDTQKAIWQREIKNGAYYAPSEQCVYISFATGTSQPFDVIKSQQMYLELMLEILQKIILHFEFVTTISNILYLASFQPEDQVEKWLQEVQKLPPVDFLRKKKRTRDYKEENMLEEEEIKTSLLKRARSIDGIPPVPSSFQTNIYTWQSGFSNSFPPPPPSHNTSFSLIAPPMMSLANTMTQEERTAIGRWGEEFAYRMLVTEYASKQNEVKVVWVNEHEESGEPYDLKMIWTQGKSRKEEYIEVKSTRTTEKGLFEVTINEFEYASIHGSNYSIFRVFNAGNDALCRVLRFRNPVALVRQKKIQLALVLQ